MLTTLAPEQSLCLQLSMLKKSLVCSLALKLKDFCCRLLLDTLEKGGQQAQAAALAAEVKAAGITPAMSMQL